MKKNIIRYIFFFYILLNFTYVKAQETCESSSSSMYGTFLYGGLCATVSYVYETISEAKKTLWSSLPLSFSTDEALVLNESKDAITSYPIKSKSFQRHSKRKYAKTSNLTKLFSLIGMSILSSSSADPAPMGCGFVPSSPSPYPDNTYGMLDNVCINYILVDGWASYQKGPETFEFGKNGVPSRDAVLITWPARMKDFFLTEAYSSRTNLTITFYPYFKTFQQSENLNLNFNDFDQWLQAFQVPTLEQWNCGVGGPNEPYAKERKYFLRTVSGNLDIDDGAKRYHGCSISHNMWISAFPFGGGQARAYPAYRFTVITASPFDENKWKTLAHESAHMYGAFHEYSGTNCTLRAGLNMVINGNAVSGGCLPISMLYPCIMDPPDSLPHLHFCRFTKGQLGWDHDNWNKQFLFDRCGTGIGVAMVSHSIDHSVTLPRLYIAHTGFDNEVYVARTEPIPDITKFDSQGCGGTKVGFLSSHAPALASIQLSNTNQFRLYLFLVEKADSRIRYISSEDGISWPRPAFDLFSPNSNLIYVPPSPMGSISVSKDGYHIAVSGGYSPGSDRCRPEQINGYGICLLSDYRAYTYDNQLRYSVDFALVLGEKVTSYGGSIGVAGTSISRQPSYVVTRTVNGAIGCDNALNNLLNVEFVDYSKYQTAANPITFCDDPKPGSVITGAGTDLERRSYIPYSGLTQSIAISSNSGLGNQHITTYWFEQSEHASKPIAPYSPYGLAIASVEHDLTGFSRLCLLTTNSVGNFVLRCSLGYF